MSQTVIKVENLSKQYRLGQVGTGTLSHDLNRWWANLRGKEDPFKKVTATNDRSVADGSEYVWALKDINFEVQRGEVLGIIGKNGAGKSTLLKILSKVTGPTTGTIKTKGRIASLLEVGTGFHPEMTGRENIYMNGTLNGMRRHEIKAKLDEIVDFAGVAKYLDTPTKRYSSGMTVRLGFAVAAFLEPEILVVDEVLAVGDAEFQKKAIGKMRDISNQQGRTVLLVSHNMTSIRNLCSESLLLLNGSLVLQDATETVISKYINSTTQNSILANKRKGSQIIQITNIYLWDEDCNEISSVSPTQEFSIHLVYKICQPIDLDGLIVGIGLSDRSGNRILLHHNRLIGSHFSKEMISKGDIFKISISSLNLNVGDYQLHYSVMNGMDYIDHMEDAFILSVMGSYPYNYLELPSNQASLKIINARWSIE